MDRIGGQLERRKPGELTDLPRDHLVDRDSGADVGRALLQAHARQERPIAASMVTAAIRSAKSRAVVQAAENLDRALEWLERGQCVPKLILSTGALGPPGLGNRTVGKINEGRTQRSTGGCAGKSLGFRRGGERVGPRKRLKSRKRDAYPQPAEKSPPVERRRNVLGQISSTTPRFSP